MKLVSALVLAACAFTSVEATKPGMHNGRLTLQDLLALRNSVLLPEMSKCMCCASNRLHATASSPMAGSGSEGWHPVETISANTPRATESTYMLRASSGILLMCHQQSLKVSQRMLRTRSWVPGLKSANRGNAKSRQSRVHTAMFEVVREAAGNAY